MDPINAVNWKDYADAFLTDKKRLCSIPELLKLVIFAVKMGF